MNFNVDTFNISDEKRALIHILEMIYRDNLNEINFYRTANNEIRQSITNILGNQNFNNNRVRGSAINSLLNTYLNNGSNNRASRTRNITSTPNRYTVSGTNTNNVTPSRIYSNGLDLTSFSGTPALTEVHEFTIPINSTSSSLGTEFLTAFFNQFLQPVEVYPTQSQIEAATRVVKYNDILNPSSQDCPISLERFNADDTVMVIRHCNHVFKQNSLMEWFRGHCLCPVCRYDIRTYTPDTRENTSN